MNKEFRYGALQGIRTPDLLVRSQTLYPAELAAHFLMLRYYITTAKKNQVLFESFFKKLIFIFIILEFVPFKNGNSYFFLQKTS